MILRAAGITSLALTLATSFAAHAQETPTAPTAPTAADMEEPTGDSLFDAVPAEVTDQISSQLFFDATQTSFNRDMNRQTFDGEVVAIGAGTIVAADHLALDREAQTLEARGHVLIMSRGAVFTGDAVRYSMKTTDFAIDGAVMVANDKAKADEVTQRVLGLTPREVVFESERKERLKEIELRKSRLAREARRQARKGQSTPDPDLFDRYVRLFEEQDLVTAQENPSLARLPEERREMYKRRRAFWEQSRANALLPSGQLATMYFRLEGESLSRTAGNDYVAKDALFTPCRCEDDEAPAWGFRADQIDAQIGGYADLHHPVLEIKGIPVLYLPFLKIPLKDERQSGFLMPTFAFERRAGNIYSQPVFFDLGRSSDATLTTDFFENRGTRLGVEYRVQQRQFSGWELGIEGMRDRLWMRDRGVREDLRSLYGLGLNQAAADNAAYSGMTQAQRDDLYAVRDGDSDRGALERQLSDPGYWRGRYGDAFDQNLVGIENELTTKLAVPSNTWRGAYSWRGVSFFAPRLSLVSSARVVSDHRYDEDLYVPDDFEKAFFGGREAKAFSNARARLHLDGRDFYLGTGTAFGDHHLLDERFQGQQMPLSLKLQSRKISLLPDGSPIPMWGQLTTEQVRITEFKPSDELQAAADPVSNRTLGDGLWQRVRFDTVSPLLTETPIQISHFTDLEARFIEHAELGGHRSRIRSWTTGLEFSLPIDGKGELADYFQDDDEEAGRKFGHHLMDWRLRFSVRPSVVKRGAYADDEVPKEGLAYFASDLFDPANADTDTAVPEEERMRQHQRMSLTTDHAWKLFRREYTAKPTDDGKTKPNDGGRAAAADARERARLELTKELERPKLPSEDQYDPDTGRWVVDKFTRADSYYATPVSVSAGVAYDFQDAKEREEIRAKNRETGTNDALPKAWKDPTLSASARHEGFTLGASGRYDVYARLSPQMDLNLGLPRFVETNVTLGYGITKDAPAPGSIDFVESHERRLNIVTSLAHPVTGYIRLQRRDKDDVAPTYSNRFETALGLAYDSPSECWGLQFAREKLYTKDERQATYVLRFAMVLVGQRRNLPNMSPAFTKEGEPE